MGTIKPETHPLPNGQTLRIRNVDPTDAEILLAMVTTSVGEGKVSNTEPDEFCISLAQERRWIENHLTEDGQVIIVAESEGQIVAYLNFENGSKKRLSHHGSFGMIVNEEWRNLGIGRTLLRVLLAWADRHPVIEKVTLTVMSDNAPAMALYRRLGFIEEGRLVHQVKRDHGQYVDHVLMAKFLDKKPREHSP